jgi:hypothetical protein
MNLSPGDHRFRYVADGRAFADYASFGLELGPFGYDSVVRVNKIRGGWTNPSLRTPARRRGNASAIQPFKPSKSSGRA